MTFSAKLAVVGISIVAASISPLGGYVLTRTVKNQIEKEGIEMLDLADASETNKENYKDHEEWKKILKKDGSAEDTEAKSFASWNDSDNDDYKKINKIKQQCKKELEIRYWSKEFWNSVSKIKKFCAKKSS